MRLVSLVINFLFILDLSETIILLSNEIYGRYEAIENLIILGRNMRKVTKVPFTNCNYENQVKVLQWRRNP